MSATLAAAAREHGVPLSTVSTWVKKAEHAGHEPDAWAAWADVRAALLAVRAAQGRDARARRYAAGASVRPSLGRQKRGRRE